MDARAGLGAAAESTAAAMYERAGFEVLERNFRCRLGEIDLITRRGRLIVFCEVKARTSERFGAPSEAVNDVKRTRIRKLASEWLRLRRPGPADVRFDVVSVIVRPRHCELTHVPDAF